MAPPAADGHGAVLHVRRAGHGAAGLLRRAARERGYEIFREAYRGVSGLCRTVRGPSMSATPGKVCVDGIAEVSGQRVFVLHLIQARDPSLVGRPFFARYDPDATWLTELEPAFADHFPFDSASEGSPLCAELPTVPSRYGPGPPDHGPVPPVWRSRGQTLPRRAAVRYRRSDSGPQAQADRSVRAGQLKACWSLSPSCPAATASRCDRPPRRRCGCGWCRCPGS